MSFHHQFVGQTEGIRARGPARWRLLDGMTSVFWEASGQRGAGGYYLSDRPRIMVFFNDVSSILMSNDSGEVRPGRPLERVLFVPSGLPMWTRFTADHSFSHLDIHFQQERLLKMLAPAVGRAQALDILARPLETGTEPLVETLARLVVDETCAPDRHPLRAESLVSALVTGVLELGESAGPGGAEGRLTRGQMRRLVEQFHEGGGQSLSVADMAERVGLSESWFTRLFKNTTGETPLKWQLRQRVELAQDLLASGLSVAEVSGRLGFTDQAHLTRVFRQVTGETPGAWRRARRMGVPR
ncbi:helix-turn-helix domain-containing protein (plasmid) [Cereibacter azotoformans]|uniref:Transcriptional regulator, AraC family n=1 Tax=Cereibacter sphaeroides (strain ATCC 17025 / ATH 2.4.3) TaxID=349102 RepID=A4WXU6_CERS5